MQIHSDTLFNVCARIIIFSSDNFLSVISVTKPSMQTTFPFSSYIARPFSQTHFSKPCQLIIL